MAAPCLGSFGAYKTAYSKYRADLERMRTAPPVNNPKKEVTWVQKRYDPLDLRPNFPVPIQKTVYFREPQVPTYWIPGREVPPRYHNRAQTSPYLSQASTRCEDWSTLRQMLPSRGAPIHPRAPSNWGTAASLPPVMITRVKEHHDHINSPMTRFMDTVHINDPLFRLY